MLPIESSSPAHIPLLSLVSTLHIFAGHKVLVPGTVPEEGIRPRLDRKEVSRAIERRVVGAVGAHGRTEGRT